MADPDNKRLFLASVEILRENIGSQPLRADCAHEKSWFIVAFFTIVLLFNGGSAVDSSSKATKKAKKVKK